MTAREHYALRRLLALLQDAGVDLDDHRACIAFSRGNPVSHRLLVMRRAMEDHAWSLSVLACEAMERGHDWVRGS